MCQSALHEARVDLRLVGGSGSTFDFTLEAGIRDEFDGELKHEAVWVLFSKLVEKVAPCSILDHFLKPGRGLRREGGREGRGERESRRKEGRQGWRQDREGGKIRMEGRQRGKAEGRRGDKDGGKDGTTAGKEE